MPADDALLTPAPALRSALLRVCNELALTDEARWLAARTQHLWHASG